MALEEELPKLVYAHSFWIAEGQKMSKSLGNVTNLVDLVERYDPRAYRLLVLQSHYRSPIDVTDDSLRNAEGGLDRLDAFAEGALGLRPWVSSVTEEELAGMKVMFGRYRDADPRARLTADAVRRWRRP